MNPEGGVHFLPPIAGFVGSDALAVVAATRLARTRLPAMAIDIGTNTEISLSVDGQVTSPAAPPGRPSRATRSPTGMKAVEGAIERVSFSRGRARREHLHHRRRPACRHLRLRRGRRAGRPGARPASSTAAAACSCTRACAKGSQGREYLVADGRGATSSSRSTTCARCSSPRAPSPPAGPCSWSAPGWTWTTCATSTSPAPSATTWTCAIAWPSACCRRSPRERIAFVGNAAGVGAQMALLDVRARRRIAQLRARIGFLELATDPGFHDEFAARLGFS